MNIQLKKDKTFVDEKTDHVYIALFGGVKLMNLSIEQMALNFQVKFFASKESMNNNKTELFKETFSIHDDYESEEPELNLIKMLKKAPSKDTIKESIEIELYNYIINLDKYKNFEIV